MPGSNLGGSQFFTQINNSLTSISLKKQSLFGIQMQKRASTILEDDELMACDDLAVNHYMNPF